jgi:hypothetical protein
LEQLQNVLIDEFSTTFVETFLLERMKLAGYLMRCSHFLSHPTSEEDDDDDDFHGISGSDVSQDLKPCFHAVSRFLLLCSDCENEDIMEDQGQNFAVHFAPRVMRAKVMPLLADKFLEVALDWHGLTPEIIPEGAKVFARDVDALFASFATGESKITNVKRLVDVASLMSMPSKSLVATRDALLGLVGGPEDPGRPWRLNSNQFIADTTLYEQASLMLRAKGICLDVEDAISILNRRRDLMTRPGVAF